MSQFERYCIRNNIKATFVDGYLISPIPKIRIENRIRNEQYFVNLILKRYPFSSVVEAMQNDKIILNL